MLLCHPERRRAAFFMVFCVLVVLLLRIWVNSFSPENEEYGIIIGIVRFRVCGGAQHGALAS